MDINKFSDIILMASGNELKYKLKFPGKELNIISYRVFFFSSSMIIFFN